MFVFFMGAAMPLLMGVWIALLHNFAIEQADYIGVEICILQSLWQIPGFLSFGTVLLLALLYERTLTFVLTLVLGLRTSMTGFLPAEIGLHLSEF
jgi:hypothetical protein